MAAKDDNLIDGVNQCLVRDDEHDDGVAFINVVFDTIQLNGSPAACVLDLGSHSPSASPSEGTPSHSPSGSPSGTPSGSPSVTPSHSPSVTPSFSPSMSPSGSASMSPSLSPSGSPSQSPSATPSFSPSASPSGSPSFSPSGSPSGSPSISPSATPSVTPSHSPSASVVLTEDYSYGEYVALPTNTTNLTNGYTAQDYLDVESYDAAEVGVDGSAPNYILHQFKDYVGTEDHIRVIWKGNSTLAPSSSAVYLQIYHQINGWENVVSNNSAAADIDFELSEYITTTNYVSGEMIACRVYQQVQ